MATADPRDLVPLKAEVFEILLRLSTGPCHGYAIMRDVEAATGGDVDMLPGTLYRHLRWMLERDLIAETTDEAPDGGSERRRKVYGMTELGRGVLELEAARLADRVAAAREVHLLPGDRS